MTISEVNHQPTGLPTVAGSKLKVREASSISNLQPANPLREPVTDIAIAVRHVNKLYPLCPDPRDRLKSSPG
jgi:hypothetical protein